MPNDGFGSPAATLGTLFLPMITKAIGLKSTLALLAILSGLGFLITASLGRGLLPTFVRADDVRVDDPSRVS